jgi:hypothetical protein
MPEVRVTIEKICCQLVDLRRVSRQLKRGKPRIRNTGSEKTTFERRRIRPYRAFCAPSVILTGAAQGALRHRSGSGRKLPATQQAQQGFAVSHGNKTTAGEITIFPVNRDKKRAPDSSRQTRSQDGAGPAHCATVVR